MDRGASEGCGPWGGTEVRQAWTAEQALTQTGPGLALPLTRLGERAASTPSVPLYLGQVALTHPLAGAGDRGHAGARSGLAPGGGREGSVITNMLLRKGPPPLPHRVGSLRCPMFPWEDKPLRVAATGWHAAACPFPQRPPSTARCPVWGGVGGRAASVGTSGRDHPYRSSGADSGGPGPGGPPAPSAPGDRAAFGV